MKQTFLVLVYCFVLASPYSIRAETHVNRKLKQTNKVLSPETDFTIKAREVSIESVSTNFGSVFTFTGRRKTTRHGRKIMKSGTTFLVSIEHACIGLPPPVENCTESMQKSSNAKRTEGRLRLFATTSLKDCCEKCRRGKYGRCRSWWRENGNGSRLCYLSMNR
eukprot:g3737.t2